MKSSKPPQIRTRRQAREAKPKPKDPVEVYCRVRPLKDDENTSCADVQSDTTLQLTPPQSSLAFKSGHTNGAQYIFKRVFKDSTQQQELFDTVALPLVSDLLQGKNGLMFAYGITNSGKTYTMTGESDQPGILPRVMDVMFNSIADLQAQKFVFRPDKSNHFNVFTEESARREREQYKPRKISPRQRAEMPNFTEMIRVPDYRKVDGLDEDSSYAVFVSYIEIYNNYMYDLLDESSMDKGGLHPKPPQSKLLREDSSHNMYVSGGTEVEVKTTEEAFEVLWQGQRRRRVAHTQLNHESSRSHSVFTIRLVQAPLDQSGAEVFQDKSKIAVAQLSLVDLAGSERTSRTQSGGDRLREAGNINHSLMVLRTCMETLRDNQLNDANKIVPYRDSKLTHLFKNSFDGEGKVRMIVCVSPNADDYDETIHVMRFAEVTQEVAVDRPTTCVKFDIGLAPGRRRANMLYKAVMKEATVLAETVEPPPHPYKLQLGVICLQQFLNEGGSVNSIRELKKFLDQRAKTRGELQEALKKKQSEFRSKLVAQDEELKELRAMVGDYQAQKISRERAQRDTQRLKGVINNQEKQITQLNAEVSMLKASLSDKEKELSKSRSDMSRVTEQRDYLMRTTELYERSQRELEKQLTEKNLETAKEAAEKEQLQKKMKGYVWDKKEKIEKIERLTRQMHRKQKELHVRDQKLSQLKEIISNSPLTTDSTTVVERTPLKETLPNKDNTPLRSNRKRSLSENWLEHKPSNTVDNGDLLQPNMKKKRTVTNPKTKHLVSGQVDKYVLKHQQKDSNGGVQTELYKGNILPTRGGGASVQFTDVEKLNHSSPTKGPPPRVLTRSMSRRIDASECSSLMSSSMEDEEDAWTDVETRCAVGIEGRPGSQPAFSHIATKRKTRRQL